MTCPHCKGEGYLVTQAKHGIFTVQCSKCFGTGTINVNQPTTKEKIETGK